MVTTRADHSEEVEEPAARRRLLPAGLRSRVGQAVRVMAFGLLLLAIWQAIYVAELLSEFIVPAPADTFDELGRAATDLATGGPVFHATLVTLWEVVAGFAIAGLTGIMLGIVVGDTTFGRTILMPYVVALNAVPKIALAPVFVAWLGFGVAPKILLAAFIAFFPVVVNTAVGIESYSQNSFLLFQSMEASRWQTLVKLKFPNSLPYVFAGLKTAAVLAVIGAIVAEFLGGSARGIGELIRLAAGRLQIDTVFALIIVLSLVGLLLYGAIIWLERWVVYWRRAERSTMALRG